jgi:PAS domain S-box-containing protein
VDSKEENEQQHYGEFCQNLIGRIEYADEKFCRTFGYSKEEIMSINFLQLIHPDHYEKANETYSIFLSNGSLPSEVKGTYVDKSGRTLELTLILEPRIQNERHVGIYGRIISIKEGTVEQNQNDTNKRTFQSLRTAIIFSLLKEKLSINQIATATGINWRTVENHLTYLMGKKLVNEVFASKYVRVFELTEFGKATAELLKKEQKELSPTNHITLQKGVSQ